ncbi:cobalamin B12-binding domain-containing protein [Amycolatopsis acidicola]|uniref:cobalamin B12-binding domain-containing protein n=1 Tax=Amycolatopsis acidicola TaxID=2596893 RepID=UPI001FB5D4D3|nr:cobalamin-dependent protein [Amycolatopsis acidicola]
MRIDALAREFGELVSTVDSEDAVALVERALDDGADPMAVLVDVIAAAQRRVGFRWQRGEWSVAQEHAATAVAVSATEAVTRRARLTPAARGRVVLACAEREWHAMPAMIIGGALRGAGWSVTMLGAATPAARLTQYLHDLGPDVTAVSCSMPGALPATRRIIEASTADGIPVLAGGPAFGTDSARADALGATAWAPTAREVAQVIAGLPPVVPAVPPLPAGPANEQASLELDHEALAATLLRQWSPGPDWLAADIKDVVDLALHCVGAALLTGDARPLPDTAAWVSDLLTSRGADNTTAGELGEQLAHVLREYPLARNLVTAHWA